MSLIQTLKNTGLSNKQADVYLAALELGQSGMTRLAKKAGLKRPTTYLVVEELIALGLVTETLRGKRKSYAAVHPNRLSQIANFRAKEVSEILPELIALHKSPKQRPKIQVFEGVESVRQLYKEIYAELNNKSEALWLTRVSALDNVPEAVTGYKQRVASRPSPKIRELDYGDESGRRWYKEIKRIMGNNHQIRLLPTEFPFGESDNVIFEDKVVIFQLGKDVSATVIESHDVASTYKTLFEWAWKQGK